MDFITKMTDLFQHYTPNANEDFLNDGKAKHLLRAILEKEVATDREAVRYMYGPSSQPSEKKFLMLKKELEERLVDQLLQTPTSSGKDATRAPRNNKALSVKLWCRKQLMITELLLAHNEYSHAEKLLSKISSRAEKHLFYHIQEESALLLRQVYARQGEIKKLARQEIKISQIQDTNICITRAIGWQQQMEAQNSQSVSLSTTLGEEALRRAEIIGEWRRKGDHPFLAYYHHYHAAEGYLHFKDLEGFQSSLRRKVALLRQFTFFRDRSHLLELLLDRLLVCQSLNDMKSSVRFANRLRTKNNVPIALRSRFYKDLFGVYMRSSEYQRAAQVLSEVKRVNRSSKVEQSQWYVKEAYLYYMFLVKKEDASIRQLTPQFSKGFSPALFDQLTQPLSYDKRGYQVQALIIKTILLKHFGRIENTYHLRSLQTYYQRHLRDLIEQRTQIFFQMVAKTAVSSVARSKAGTGVDLLYQSMKEIPRSIIEGQEIIPYEVLWEAQR